MNGNEKRAILARLATSLIFGCSFIFSKEALQFITPAELLSFRFLIAAVILHLMKKLNILEIHVDFKSFKKIRPLLCLSVFQPVIGYFFEMEGVYRLTVAESGIILSTIPVFVTIISAFYIKERPNKKQLGFIILSSVGIICILILKDISFSNIEYLGGIFLIIGAFSAAIYTVLARKLSGEFRYEEITYVMMVSGACFFNGIHLIKCIANGSFETYHMLFSNTSVWVPALYLGLGSSVAGFLLTNFSLSMLAAFRVAIFNNLATVISIIIGIFLTKDSFTIVQTTGVIMIISGVWGTNYFSPKEKVKSDV